MFSLASKTSAKKLPQRFEVVSAYYTGNGTSTQTIPSTVQAGDIMVIYNVVRNTSGIPTTVIPSGFTSLVNTTLDISNVASRGITSYRVLADVDAGRTITVMSAANEHRYQQVVFRFPVPIISVTSVSGQGNTYFDERSSINQTFVAGTSPTLFVGCNSHQYLNSSKPDVAGLSFTTQTGNAGAGSSNPGMSYYNGYDTTVANTYSGIVETRYGYANRLWDIVQSGRLDLSIT